MRPEKSIIRKIHDYDAHKLRYASYAIGREFVWACTRRRHFIYFILYFIFWYFISRWYFSDKQSIPACKFIVQARQSSKRVVRAFGACDIYPNLPPRKGFVKIAGTRFPLSRRMHTSRDAVAERKKERKKERERQSGMRSDDDSSSENYTE